jgi:hypothetical protein
LAIAAPDFSLTALKNHVDLIDRDAGALKYLSDLRFECLPSNELKPVFNLIQASSLGFH